MNLLPHVKFITIKDIAKRIAFESSDSVIERTIRQLRHWTQNDLLRTIGEKNTGKGIPRLYEDEPTLLISAILQELTLYGASIETLKPVAKALYEHWDRETGMYFTLALNEGNSYLQVVWSIDSRTGKFFDAEINFFDDIDRDAGHELLLEHPSSSVVVNMSMLTERIYVTNSEGEADEVDHD